MIQNRPKQMLLLGSVIHARRKHNRGMYRRGWSEVPQIQPKADTRGVSCIPTPLAELVTDSEKEATIRENRSSLRNPLPKAKRTAERIVSRAGN